MAQKPGNLVYGLDDRPPLVITFFLAMQHISVIVIGFLFPVIIVREIGGSMDDSVRFVSASMLAGGIAVIVQSLRKGPAGSGFLCPEVCGPSYLAASMLAAKTGGLSLVFGMTLVASLFEGILSKIMRHLRVLFPAEVTGMIVMMVGLTVIKVACKNFFGEGGAETTISLPAFFTGLLTLATMIGLNIWGKGKAKLFCALIGMMVGYVLAAFFGVLDFSKLGAEFAVPFFATPFAGHPGWSFDVALIAPFLVAVLCSTLKTVGDLTTCQRINDAKWKRPDMDNISRGILADGCGAFVAGIAGGFGQSTSSSNIGLSIGTGATSRVIAKWIGVILIILSFFPKASVIFAIMPQPVLGATLFFALSFMVVAGIQIIMSRMIDGRKTFVVGLSIIIGLSVDIVPGIYSQVPTWLAPVVSSSLAASTIMALILNLLFRIGIAQSATLKIEPGTSFSEAVFNFMEQQGGLWGARHEVIHKAASAMSESVEAVIALNGVETPVEMTARFDEFNLDIAVTYQGAPLARAQALPSIEDMVDEKKCAEMSMFMVQKYSDRCVIEEKGGSNILKLHFAH
ncbi:MAG: solute carrier family 23 protein [Pseudomonadota bacterium]|nr:solute carrier family 23 protein [Pseudomonadota bacterium]